MITSVLQALDFILQPSLGDLIFQLRLGHLNARQFLRHVGVRLRWRRSRLKGQRSELSQLGPIKWGFRYKWEWYGNSMGPKRSHSWGSENNPTDFGVTLRKINKHLRIQTPPDRTGFFGFQSNPKRIGM